MVAHTLVKPAPQTQVSASQVWDTLEAEIQVDDYIRLPYTPVVQVLDKFTRLDGKVSLLVKPLTGAAAEEWLVESEPAEEPTQPQPEQPVGFAGDVVCCQLRPSQKVVAEYEQGYHHGQQDASQELHPMYPEATCDYTKGYLQGYNAVLNPTQPPQLQAEPKQDAWSVIAAPNWEDGYQAWVGAHCIGNEFTYERAESTAMAYVATNRLIRRQNTAVMLAYAE